MNTAIALLALVQCFVGVASTISLEQAGQLLSKPFSCVGARPVSDEPQGWPPAEQTAIIGADNSGGTHTLAVCAQTLFARDVARPTVPAGIAGIDRVFVVHYAPLKDRKPVLEALLKSTGIQANWLETFGREDMKANPQVHECLFTGLDASYGAAASSWSVISALAQTVAHGWKNVLIIEDDVRLPHTKESSQNVTASNFKSMLENLVSCSSEMDSGNGFDSLHITRTVAGFVVSQMGARKVMALLSANKRMPVIPAIDMLIPALSVQALLGPVGASTFRSEMSKFCKGHSTFTQICKDWDKLSFLGYDTRAWGCSKFNYFSVMRADYMLINGQTGSWQQSEKVEDQAAAQSSGGNEMVVGRCRTSSEPRTLLRQRDLEHLGTSKKYVAIIAGSDGW